MKKFRIAKCLDGNEIAEFAIFEDGSEKARVYEDDCQYGKYIEIKNELYTKEADPDLKYTFTGRIKDAVETIRSGEGDAIVIKSIMGMKFIDVVYFLDRKIGDELRAKSIDGFKNAEFGYQIVVSNYLGCYQVNIQNEAIMFGTTNQNPLIFESEELGNRYMSDLIKSAHSYAEKAIEISQNENFGAKFALKAVGDDIAKEFGSKRTIVRSMMSDLVKVSKGDNLEYANEDHDFENFDIMVWQRLLTKEDKDQRN